MHMSLNEFGLGIVGRISSFQTYDLNDFHLKYEQLFYLESFQFVLGLLRIYISKKIV